MRGKYFYTFYITIGPYHISLLFLIIPVIPTTIKLPLIHPILILSSLIIPHTPPNILISSAYIFVSSFLFNNAQHSEPYITSQASQKFYKISLFYLLGTFYHAGSPSLLSTSSSHNYFFYLHLLIFSYFFFAQLKKKLTCQLYVKF